MQLFHTRDSDLIFTLIKMVPLEKKLSTYNRTHVMPMENQSAYIRKILERLLSITKSVKELAEFLEDTGVGRDGGVDLQIPLDRLIDATRLFVDTGDLAQHLGLMPQHRMQPYEAFHGLFVKAHASVGQAQVKEGFNARGVVLQRRQIGIASLGVLACLDTAISPAHEGSRVVWV